MTHIDRSRPRVLLFQVDLRDRLTRNQMIIRPLSYDRAIVGIACSRSGLVLRGQRQRAVKCASGVAGIRLRVGSYSNAVPTTEEICYARSLSQQRLEKQEIEDLGAKRKQLTKLPTYDRILIVGKTRSYRALCSMWR